jgi:adenine phosphoribosyltransferase
MLERAFRTEARSFRTGGATVFDRQQIVQDLAKRVRNVPDFPVAGILFRDITPILQDQTAFQSAVDLFVDTFRRRDVEVFAGIESRGFLFAAPTALALGAGFVPVRKAGKLPAAKVERSYDLEYGTATLELHRDAVRRGQRVVIIDDLLATGGTAQAACALVEELGGTVLEVAFLIELEALRGRDRLAGRQVTSFLRY